MSTPNMVWAAIAQELIAQGKHFLPDTEGGGELWLSYEAIAFLTGLKTKTIEDKCSGLQRHCLAPMVKLSDLEAKENAGKSTPKPKASKKTRRKRAPSR